jgi:serine/threonine protein phosphatase PrpC
MLMGLVLLAVGVALLGYVVVARQPQPTPTTSQPSTSTKSPLPVVELEDSSDTDETQVMRVHAPLESAALEAVPEVEELPAADLTPIAPTITSKVIVAYEDEAEEEENTSPQARILVTASGDTDRGHHRRANDDSLLVMPEQCLFAVADGMGGYAGGSVASQLAMAEIQRAFEQQHFLGSLRSASPIPRRGRELASSIIQAHHAVAGKARATPELAQMGTTLVAARFSPNKQRVYIGHVGDSRCYRYRRGGLRQLTTDQVMSTVGLIGPHADDLLQAVGVSPHLSVDLIVDKPQAGDIYLLCSDGLNKMVPDQQIKQVLAQQRDLEAAVYGLIELANDAGGRDNVTVVLVKVLDRALQDVATVPCPPPESKGWSRLPDVTPAEACSTDDETVVGRLSEVELSKLRLDPARAKHSS